MDKKLLRDCGIGINFITPEEYLKIAKKDKDQYSLKELTNIANRKANICDSCEEYPEWKLGDCGLCFSCTTGESDASDDYEIVTNPS